MVGRRTFVILVCAVATACSGAAPTAAPPTPGQTPSPAAITPAPATPTIAPTPTVAPTPTAAPPTASPTVPLTATLPSPTPSPTPAAETLTSDDGLLAVTIPANALPAGASLRITTKGQADAPPELEDVTFRSAFYGLDAGGVALNGPLMLSRTIDLEALELDPMADGLPIVALTNRTAAGKWSWLGDQSLWFDGTAYTVTGSLMELGDVYGFNISTSLGLSYVDFTAPVETEFRWGINLKGPLLDLMPDQRPYLIDPGAQVGEGGFLHVGEATLDDPERPTQLLQTFGCDLVGQSMVGVTKRIQYPKLTPLYEDTLQLPTPFTMSGTLWAPVTCTEAAAQPPKITIRAFCIKVEHTPLGNFLSYLLAEMGFFGEGLDLIEKVEILIKGANNDKPIVITGDFDPEHLAEKFGLFNPGEKQIVHIKVTMTGFGTVDVTDQVREKIDKFKVRFPQEDLFGFGFECDQQ